MWGDVRLTVDVSTFVDMISEQSGWLFCSSNLLTSEFYKLCGYLYETNIRSIMIQCCCVMLNWID